MILALTAFCVWCYDVTISGFGALGFYGAGKRAGAKREIGDNKKSQASDVRKLVFVHNTNKEMVWFTINTLEIRYDRTQYTTQDT